MKLLISSIVFLLITACFGCGFISKNIVFQVKDPKTEDSTSISKWLELNSIIVDGVMTVAPESYYSSRFYFSSGPMVFTDQGTFISIGYDGLKFCPNGVCKTYKIINPQVASDTAYKNHLLYWNAVHNRSDTIYPSTNKFEGFSRDLNGNRLTESFFSDSQYKIIIPFTLFWGSKAQVKSIREFIKATRENSTKIQIILLNFDKQLWWGEEWNKQIQVFG